MRTLYSDTHAVTALTQALRTNGTVNGPTVDLGVFGNDFRTVAFVVQTGTITDGTHTISVQDSPDGSAWTAVDTGRIQGTAPAIGATDDDKTFYFGVILGGRQYIRLVATTAGATTGGSFGATAIMGAPSQSPPARS